MPLVKEIYGPAKGILNPKSSSYNSCDRVGGLGFSQLPGPLTSWRVVLYEIQVAHRCQGFYSSFDRPKETPIHIGHSGLLLRKKQRRGTLQKLAGVLQVSGPPHSDGECGT